MEDWLICLPLTRGNPGGFDDNLYGRCSKCEEPVQYRPGGEGELVCLPCFEKEVRAGNADPVEVKVTPKTTEEVRRWLDSGEIRSIMKG